MGMAKLIKSTALGISLLILGASGAHAAGSTEGTVVGIDVFDSQRARFKIKKSNGEVVPFWIRFDFSTGNAMLSSVMLAASMGNFINVWYANEGYETFGGQTGIVANIIFQGIPN